MTAFALALVLAAAFVHAGWNYLLKRSGGGALFVWSFAALSSLFYAPIAAAVLWWLRPGLGWTALGLIAASALLHTAYYLLLDRGYRNGDLSLVYPLARASGPLVTVAVAVLLLGERPTALALAGAGLIAAGALVIAGPPGALRAQSVRAVAYALLTGCAISAYTVVDKLAVAAFFVPPVVQDWGANLGRTLLMTPFALRHRGELRATWRRSKKDIVAVALLCPLSYILVLTAMVFTPVSYVAPAREVSILVAALFGTRLLAEGHGARRIAAAAAMVAGILCLAAG